MSVSWLVWAAHKMAVAAMLAADLFLPEGISIAALLRAQIAIILFFAIAATPFAVSSLAEDAAIASLKHYDKVVERVQSLVDERDRVVAGLSELGWKIPESQGNFVWLPLGENAQDFAAYAGEQALSVRAFPNEGVRVSIGEVEANTRFLSLCANYTKGPGVS